MKSSIKIVLSGAALAGAGVLTLQPAAAMPIAPMDKTDTSKVVQTVGWACGPGWHLNPWGRCVPNRWGWGYRPWGYHHRWGYWGHPHRHYW